MSNTQININKAFSDWYDSLPYGEPSYQEAFEAGAAISSDAMKFRQSLQTPPPAELSSKHIEDLRSALQFLLSEQCKAKGYFAPGAELARAVIAKTTGAA